MDTLAFCIGNIMKYAQRYGKKGGKNRADLLKVLHYALFMLYVHDNKGDLWKLVMSWKIEFCQPHWAMNYHCILAAVVDSSHGGDLCSPQAFLEAGLLVGPNTLYWAWQLQVKFFLS